MKSCSMNFRLEVFIFLVLIVLGCDKPFSYSPFEATVPDDLRNSTAKNLQKIRDRESATGNDFKIAVLSDAHYHFNDLRDAIDRINADTLVAFVVVTGDLTENGLLKEFEIFHQLMSSLNTPYLTVIGNHDYLSNGVQVYRQIFGPVNYSFFFKDFKFIMWDNIRWESNSEPDWKWFRAEISDRREDQREASRIIPFSHIPPNDGQLADSAAVIHKLFLENGIRLSVHGHKHEYTNEQLYPGVRYVTIGSPDKRGYVELSMSPDSVRVSKIRF
jgi:3',5'-cyclic-AMP phosphodiesterase